MEKQTDKTLDIYLLAGQSNMSGTSLIEGTDPEKRDLNVYETVRYYSARHPEFGPVREGQGYEDGRIGPELGAAEVLAPHYDGEERQALLLKSAGGATSLLLHEDREGNLFFDRETAPKRREKYYQRGSWYPELLIPASLKEDRETYAQSRHGRMIRGLKDDARTVYGKYIAEGWKPENIRFQALLWMQGESDRYFPDAYAEVFPVFVTEIRQFLSFLTGEDYSTFPVVVGEISETFHSATETCLEMNRRFIAVQRDFEKKIPRVRVIPTAGFQLSRMEGDEVIPLGTDRAHWNYRDMILVGRLFGEAAFEFREENERIRKEKEEERRREALLPDPVLFRPTKTAPCYAFDHEPTAAELRETAVRAMEDELSVEWYTPESFSYRKGGAASGKSYVFRKGTPYAGLPYTDRNGTLFGMLEYLDEDGRLRTEDLSAGNALPLGQAVNDSFGNTCSGSTGFALYSCVNSIRGNMVSYTLTVKNGFFPVGNFSYDYGISEFAELDVPDPVTTNGICEKTGEQGMYECYALVQPGDLMDEQGKIRSKGHSMMVREAANVVRNADGSIDPEKSTITTLDQRTGGNLTPVGPDGTLYSFSGRVSHASTFRELFEKGYIPLTVAEFQGKKAYERARARLSGETPVRTLEELKTRTVETNYPIAVLKLLRVSTEGETERLTFHAFDRKEVGSGKAFSFPVSELPEWKNPETDGGGTLRLVAILTTGETFTLAELEEER